MLYLLILFLATQLGIWIRYFVKGVIELSQLGLSCLFLVAAIVFFIIEIIQSKKDAQFKPKSENLWQTRLTERSKTTEKKLTKGNHRIFRYRRYYPSFWQRIFVELVNAPDKYIHLAFFNETKRVEWQEYSKFTSNKAVWKVIENGIEIAEARYTPKIKDKLNFEDKLAIHIQGETYQLLSYKVSNQILVYKDSQKISEVDLSKVVMGNLEFRIHDTNEELLAMAIVLFQYLHKSG